VPNRLAVTVVLPQDSFWGRVELRCLIDGRDVVGEVFDKGPGQDPDELVGPDSLLLANAGPVEVRLAEAVCTWGCCGAIAVRVRRENGQIVWDRWYNPDVDSVPLGEFRFDADQYQAELIRADRDRDWEWPGGTVARLLRTSLAADPAVMAHWNSSVDFIQSRPSSRHEVEIVFTSPPRQVLVEYAKLFGRPMEHSQFRWRAPVTAEPPTVQAQRILSTLCTQDPRRNAEVCGGYGGRR
jgi:hypothetical protein